MRRLLTGAAGSLLAAIVLLMSQGVEGTGVDARDQEPPRYSPPSVPIVLLAGDADLKLSSQTVSLPALVQAGETVNLVVNKQLHNNGPTTPVGIDITKSITLPADCTVNGLGPGGTQIVTDTLTGVASSVSTPYQEIDAVRCTTPGSAHLIQVMNCLAPAPPDTDSNSTNNCDTDNATFEVDDGDGITEAVENGCGSDPGDPASTPERLNGIDDDGDVSIDEVLPGGAVSFDCDGDGYNGTAESWVYSGAGTRDQESCGSTTYPAGADNVWPADLGGGSFSSDRDNVSDLASFVAPDRRLGTKPGDTLYNVRWDVVPGTTFGMATINIVDLSNVAFLMPAMHANQRAFGGPYCRDLMHNRLVPSLEQVPALNPGAVLASITGGAGGQAGPVILNPDGSLPLLVPDLGAPGRKAPVPGSKALQEWLEKHYGGDKSRSLEEWLKRHYKSDNVQGGPMGHNWDFNHNRRLLTLASGNVALMDGEGRADIYRVNVNGSYSAPAGYWSSLVRNPDGSFTERYSGGQKVQYAAPSAGFSRIVSVSDRAGNTVSYTYDAPGRLTTVTDTLGRNHTYTYNAQGRLATATDFTGRTATYSYNASGQLVSVSTPAVTGTPTGNDFPTGRTTVYTYSTGSAEPQLNNNLLTVTEPVEVAASGPPRIVLVYGQTTGTLDFDRVISATIGGTNAGGVPAGGTATYSRVVINPNPPNQTTATYSRTTALDANGNLVEYDLNRLGNIVAVRRFSNRNIRPSDPVSWTTTYEYDAMSRLVRTVYPEGNSTEYTYDFSNGDRLQQGNLLSVRDVADIARGGDQAAVRTTYTYEPVYNHVKTVTEPRGNDPAYVPQNGGTQSAARYTSTTRFDYEEACDFTAIGANVGRSAAEVQALLTAAGMCSAAAGDLNGDAVTNQIRGNAVRRQNPTVTLLAGSNQAVVEGTTQQPVVETHVYNLFGQLTQTKDAEANVHTYEYYPERDPNGDGTIDNPTGNATTGGYLKQVNIDTASDALRNSSTNPTPVTVREKYDYDARGNLIRRADPRGIRTDYTYNQLDELVQVTGAAAHNVFPPDPIEPQTPVDFQFLQRYFYDHNGRLVVSQIEDRGNTSATDGNLPSADLPSVAPNPDPTGGTAFQDTVYKYDILDNLLERLEEVGQGMGDPDTREQYRYDRNGNTVLTRSPASNLAGGNPDLQLSNVASWVMDERDLTATLTRGGTTAQWQALAANDDIPGGPAIPNSGGISTVSAQHSENGNWEFSTDAEDTDGTGGPETTTYIYDGLDRLVSAVDAAGNQSFYQYDPASNLVSARAYGPVGGPTPTNNSAATLVPPLTPSSFTQPQLARRDFKYDELSRAFETNGHLYACNGGPCTGVTYVRTPVITDGPLGTPNDGLVVARAEYDRLSRMRFSVEDDTTTPNTFSGRHFYDGAGRLIRSEDPEDNEAACDLYNDSGYCVQYRETDRSSTGVTPALNETFTDRYVYDSLNRLVREVDNLGNTDRYTYDSRDNPVNSSDALNNSLISDPLGQYPGMINPDGNTSGYQYDGLSRLVAGISDLRAGGTGAGMIDTTNPSNPDGRVVADTKYDVNGRVRARADDGSVSGDNNTSFGVIEDTSPLGNVSRYVYDDLNRLTQVQYDDGTTESYTYDRDHNVTQYTDQNSNVEVQTRDAINRLIRRFWSVLASGVVGTTQQELQFDGLSRLTRATDNNSSGPTDDSIVTYAYDSLGRVLEETQQLGTGAPAVVSRQYSGAGNALVLIYPDNRQVMYAYDALDRLVNVQRTSEPPTATFTYLGARVLDRNYGNGLRLTYRNPGGADVGYDGIRRVILQQHLDTANNQAAVFAYSYDRMSNVLTEDRQHSNRGDSYQYDSLYRLTRFERDRTIMPPAPGILTNYTLDGNGNWDSQATDNNRNQYPVFLGSPRMYDNNGNLRQDGTAPGSLMYAYDAMNRLVRTDRIGAPTQTISANTWDAMDRRASRQVTNSGALNDAFVYSYSGGQVVQENKSAGTGQFVVCITYPCPPVTHGATDQLRYDPPGGAPPFFYHEDAKGNTAALSNVFSQVAERETYDAYGVVRFEDALNNPLPPAVQSSPNGNPYLFAGMQYDAETLLYEAAYKPTEGRIISGGASDWVIPYLAEMIGMTTVFPDSSSNRRDVRGSGVYTYAGGNPAGGGAGYFRMVAANNSVVGQSERYSGGGKRQGPLTLVELLSVVRVFSVLDEALLPTYGSGGTSGKEKAGNIDPPSSSGEIFPDPIIVYPDDTVQHTDIIEVQPQPEPPRPGGSYRYRDGIFVWVPDDVPPRPCHGGPLEFQTEGPIICQALFQRLAPRAGGRAAAFDPVPGIVDDFPATFGFTVTFGIFQDPPGGFFGPRSDPFPEPDPVPMCGAHALWLARQKCKRPPLETIPIELVELTLQSTNPIPPPPKK